MKTFARILIDLDVAANAHPGLDEAVMLAARCGAALKIVDVLPEIPGRARRSLDPRFEHGLIAYARERLAAVAARVTQVTVTTELLRGRPATALVDEVLRSGHELLVRSHGRDFDEHGRPFGAIDMELLRHCPCPVWLVGSRKRQGSTPQILAAVHADPDDPAEQELNRSILEMALTIQDLQGAHLSVVQAWSAFGETLLKSHMPPADLLQYVDAARAEDEKALSALTEPFSRQLAEATIELVKGEPEDVITDYVSGHGIDLVVMGTVARSGLAGVLMGNTAERMLRRLRVSVLAIKPRGFKSPASH